MYKYTYILSESYRQNTPFVTHTPVQDRHPLHTTLTNLTEINNNRQRITSHSIHTNQNKNYTNPSNNQNFRRTKVASSVPKFNYEIDNAKLLQSHKTFVPHYQESYTEGNHAVRNLKTQNSLQDTFVKLNDLSERHSEALREVQLQNKLKAISVKYKQQSNNFRQNYNKDYTMENRQVASNQNKVNYRNEYDYYKQSKVDNKLRNDYSFNTLPQAPKIEIPQKQVSLRYDYSKAVTQTGRSPYGVENANGITRKQVKRMISTHLSTAKFDKQRFNQQVQSSKQTFAQSRGRKIFNETTNLQYTPNQTYKGKKAVQKLSSLQQKIKSSIKPYLNI